MVKAAVANSLWWLASASSSAAFDSALHNPDAAQKQILRSVLAQNASTAFAREHGLSERTTADEFACRVPIRNYDELLPWIERIRRGERQVLTSEPVKRLVPTSGSTAARKLIPYTASMHAQLNQAIGPWIFDLYRTYPRALLGVSYWSISPASPDAIQFTENPAVPEGFEDDAAYLGTWRKWLINAGMVAPSAIREISSIDDWRYVTALLLLRQSNLRLISLWHPSFLSLLLQTIQDHWDQMLSDISSGRCAVAKQLPPKVARVIQTSGLPPRSQELRYCDPGKPAQLWPHLEVVSCWTDANAAGAAAELARRLEKAVVQAKGLIATEGIVSVPFRGQRPLAVRSHYFEFEDSGASILRSTDLQEGRKYSVIMTNAGGLWRYRLDDLVVVDGVLGRTPSLRFVGKCSHVSDRTGEKLSDGFVSSVFRQLFELLGIQPSFAMLAPDMRGEREAYTLYVNSDAPVGTVAELDRLLSANPHYAYCRKLGQLGPPCLFRVSADAQMAYWRRLLAMGKRLGEIKPVGLSSLDGWSSQLDGHYV
jgi:hypothetical protein